MGQRLYDITPIFNYYYKITTNKCSNLCNDTFGNLQLIYLTEW